MVAVAMCCVTARRPAGTPPPRRAPLHPPAGDYSRTHKDGRRASDDERFPGCLL
ncbi:hypothetical protein CRUP_031004 [Coryphaenoides rupestris]|nr:hypothetical protein CRUP_031004 [Coryphaenoides rupestris]